MLSNSRADDVRPPAVAGTFYPADASELAVLVDTLLHEAPTSEMGGSAPQAPERLRLESLRCASRFSIAASAVPKALIVPHAGLVYSGPIAATAYASIRQLPSAPRFSIQRVVLIGPAHRVFLTGVAAPSARHLRTPLGDLEVDSDALDRAGIPRSDAPHAREHSLEVQLPFLQRLIPDARVCPIVCGRATTSEVAACLDALWGGSETLVVVSSDLSHYLPYEEGHTRDVRTAKKIVALDSDLDGDDACGYAGIRGLLAVARARGLTAALLDLRSSGDTAGRRDAVVGYGAFAFYERAS